MRKVASHGGHNVSSTIGSHIRDFGSAIMLDAIIGRPISRVVFGTATLCDTEDCRRLLDGVYASGCNAFDTARIYTNGQSETCLGKWIRDRGLEGRVTVITKCGHAPQGGYLNHHQLQHDVEASCRALRLKSLDLLLLHRDNPRADVSILIRAVDDIIRSGRVRAFGVSNWHVSRIQEALDFAETSRLKAPCVSSPQFSLGEWTSPPWPGCVSVAGAHNRPEREWYQRTQFPVLAWSSLAGGVQLMANPREPSSGVYVSARNASKWKRAALLGRAKHATARQIALAYVLSQPANIYAVVSSSNIDHFKENMQALQIRLTEQERKWLDLETEEL